MTLLESTIALSDIVGRALDTSSGVTATSVLSFLDGEVALIGTNKGNVLFCTAAANSADLLEPMADITLHCGPVYDMALSSQHLIATAGHDAVSCVFPLHALFSNGGLTGCRRLTGHTVPVVAVKFLSEGTTLVSLGADGHVRIVDVVGGSVLAALSTGFAAACLACSTDETVLFVGGRSLAAVDLCAALRPTSFQSAAAVEVWKPVVSSAGEDGIVAAAAAAAADAARASAGVRLYQWALPASPGEEPNVAAARAKETHASATSRGTLISKLEVNQDDSTLTAVFTRGSCRPTGAQPCAEARWSAGGGRTADHTVWAPPGEECAYQQQRQQQQRRQQNGVHNHKCLKALSLRCRVKTAARPSAKQPPTSSNATSSAAALWHGRWYTSPFELSGDTEAQRVVKQLRTTAAMSLTKGDALNPPAYPVVTPPTRGEELALAEVQCGELQRECDVLVFQIRALRSAKEAARTA
ncbi:hypothetical protein ABB37_06813 [Leptomonas pyrrhocoris]|uniref:Uncharacterized protein n=1 Tax=Leptomonas pyrrhocoris TaxID=157538 RepID=A0A0M9FXG7_LEPPY|nr:hypothetical protein ABB37_06813 [Leptomonas pyrrhocoris]KPA78085.1 hypothetical protein ABB37_06813 [Leptomonas pyrrhocoris]|eukprot:XP_015656524.1 hypothetical protein ABB37_06813 [Leptomonas pyrrhocoris]